MLVTLGHYQEHQLAGKMLSSGASELQMHLHLQPETNLLRVLYKALVSTFSLSVSTTGHLGSRHPCFYSKLWQPPPLLLAHFKLQGWITVKWARTAFMKLNRQALLNMKHV